MWHLWQSEYYSAEKNFLRMDAQINLDRAQNIVFVQ